MFAIAILVPGLVLGAIAWGVVGVLRQRGREEFTQATAAALYAQVMVIAGVMATLAGAGLLLKLLLSLIDPSYSYFVPKEAGFGSSSIHDQQAQDLILASMLVGIGLITAVGHSLLARFVTGLRGGSPAWIMQGTSIVLVVLTGLAGFLSLIIGGYSALVYFLVNTQNSGFGDPVGTAAVFLPAWIVLMSLLMRRLRRVPVPPPSAMAAT
ncbi:MAG TPA: hypothetical protein VIC57_03560 [Candidatus Dormibacteraeota bacterium]